MRVARGQRLQPFGHRLKGGEDFRVHAPLRVARAEVSIKLAAAAVSSKGQHRFWGARRSIMENKTRLALMGQSGRMENLLFGRASARRRKPNRAAISVSLSLSPQAPAR
jgi:hypothetical protein